MLSDFLKGLADQLGPSNLCGSVILAALDRPVDHLIRLALRLNQRPGVVSGAWSHTFLLGDNFTGPGTRILDCTIRDKNRHVAWNEPLKDTLPGGIAGSGGIYEGVVSDYDDARVTAFGIKLIPDLTIEDRIAIVAAADSLRAAGYHYDVPGLVRELARLTLGISIPAGDKLLFCSGFCQLAYESALGQKGDFATGVATTDTTPDDIWNSSLGIGYRPALTTAAPRVLSPLAAAAPAANALGQLEHVVVLMLENRSFDHLLGFLKRELPELDGLTGAESNPVDPTNPTSVPPIPTADDAPYKFDLPVDPGHDQPDVGFQLYGTDAYDFHNTGASNGFVADYTRRCKGDAAKGALIMSAFNPNALGALAELARQFGVCDHWHSSLPGPTWPNRFFVHAATSNGQLDNNFRLSNSFDTIYHRLEAAGIPWHVYYHDIPQALAITSLWSAPLRQRFVKFAQFLDDAQAGTLPAYSFIEPRYFEFFFTKPANDAHPPHHVAEADALVGDVYNALRASPVWSKTLLVVLFDEHGGTYDHEFPPVCVAPGGGRADAPFDFTRLGVRVPAVLVSPLVPKGAIDHTVYDHSSVLGLVEQRFGLQPLTQRDQNANTPAKNLSLAAPRDDTPVSVGPAGVAPREVGAARLAAAPISPTAAAAAVDAGEASAAPLSDYQQSLVDLAEQLPIAESPTERALRAALPVTTEHDGAVRVRTRVEAFING